MTKKYTFHPRTYAGLDKLGRIPLSRHFHFREFLYSEIAVEYSIRNVPDSVDRAVQSGRQLCEKLLDPLHDVFGRIHIRSGYRSRAVNQKGSVNKHSCAADNDGAHTWDYESTSGHGFGAMACISIPSISEKILAGKVDVSALAWWVVDHLPEWSVLEFFSTPRDIPFADEVAFRSGPVSLNNFPRTISRTLADCKQCRVVHGGGGRLATNRPTRWVARGAPQIFHSTQPMPTGSPVLAA